MTVKQLVKACNQFPYISIRRIDDLCFGVNSKIMLLKLNQLNEDQNIGTVISYRPISFQEYISLKIRL